MFFGPSRPLSGSGGHEFVVGTRGFYARQLWFSPLGVIKVEVLFEAAASLRHAVGETLVRRF
jgi:hypothetical protein